MGDEKAPLPKTGKRTKKEKDNPNMNEKESGKLVKPYARLELGSDQVAETRAFQGDD